MLSRPDFGTSGAVNDVIRDAKPTIDNATKQAQDVAIQLAQQVNEVGVKLSNGVNKSLKDQPYTTLVMAGVLGLLISAIWKSSNRT